MEQHGSRSRMSCAPQASVLVDWHPGEMGQRTQHAQCAACFGYTQLPTDLITGKARRILCYSSALHLAPYGRALLVCMPGKADFTAYYFPRQRYPIVMSWF